jgi:hypothetical protein
VGCSILLLLLLLIICRRTMLQQQLLLQQLLLTYLLLSNLPPLSKTLPLSKERLILLLSLELSPEPLLRALVEVIGKVDLS